MPKIDLAEPGTICLIIQDPNGRVCQLATTVEQSKVLQILIASMSKEIPLVKMAEEYDLVFKKQKYSEEVLNNILFELDSYANKTDTELGLPTSSKHFKEMRNIILKNLQ